MRYGALQIHPPYPSFSKELRFIHNACGSHCGWFTYRSEHARLTVGVEILPPKGVRMTPGCEDAPGRMRYLPTHVMLNAVKHLNTSLRTGCVAGTQGTPRRAEPCRA